jgi:hypothetical protein
MESLPNFCARDVLRIAREKRADLITGFCLSEALFADRYN